MGFHICVDGHSLRTSEDHATIATVPLERLILATGSPYHGIKDQHESYRHLRTIPGELRDTFFPHPPRKLTLEKQLTGRNQPRAIGGMA